jgi:hypothetical protein
LAKPALQDTGMSNVKLAFKAVFTPPHDIFRLFGLLFSILSLISIFAAIHRDGFSDTLLYVLDLYDTQVENLTWIFLPLAKYIAHSFGEWFQIDLVLHAHWRHIFVLMGFYFFGEVRLNASQGIWGTALVNTLLGFSVAVAASALAGSINPDMDARLPGFWVVAIPVLGLQVYQNVGVVWDATFLRQKQAREQNRAVWSWWSHVGTGWRRGFYRTLVGLPVAAAALSTGLIRNSGEPGLFAFVILMFLFGVYWVIDGFSHTKDVPQGFGSRFETYIKSSRTQLGVFILQMFFISLTIISIDLAFIKLNVAYLFGLS